MCAAYLCDHSGGHGCTHLLFGSDPLSDDDVRPLRVVMRNPVALYCNDRDCVDVFGINDNPIIAIFAYVPFTRGSGVTLTLILTSLGHSPPFLYAQVSASVPIPLLNVMHSTRMRGG